MSRDEFYAKFRGRFLVFLTEAWAIRREQGTAVGNCLDSHHRQLKMLLEEIYDSFVEKAQPKASESRIAANGNGAVKALRN